MFGWLHRNCREKHRISTVTAEHRGFRGGHKRGYDEGVRKGVSLGETSMQERSLVTRRLFTAALNGAAKEWEEAYDVGYEAGLAERTRRLQEFVASTFREAGV